MVHRLSVGGTLGNGALAATTAHTNTVDNVAYKRETGKRHFTPHLKLSKFMDKLSTMAQSKGTSISCTFKLDQHIT